MQHVEGLRPVAAPAEHLEQLGEGGRAGERAVQARLFEERVRLEQVLRVRVRVRVGVRVRVSALSRCCALTQPAMSAVRWLGVG